MITNEWMNPAADAAAARYGAALDAWAGLYAQAAVASDLGSARSFSRLQEQALSIGSHLLSAEEHHCAHGLALVAQNAQGAVQAALGVTNAGDVSDAASEAVGALQAHFLREYAIQIERDVAHLSRALRVHALQVQVAARSRRLPLATARLQAAVAGPRALAFTMHDRGGARWPSRRYVRTLARHALLTAYNETALITLAEAGEELARIEHLSKKSEVHGMVLAMAPDTTHPTYDEIRDDVFHPNADAVIVAYGAG